MTDILALATILTALSISQVHASEQVYTDSPEIARTIVTVDIDGNIVSTFEEGYLTDDDETMILTLCLKSLYVRYNVAEKTTND